MNVGYFGIEVFRDGFRHLIEAMSVDTLEFATIGSHRWLREGWEVKEFCNDRVYLLREVVLLDSCEPPPPRTYPVAGGPHCSSFWGG